MTTMTRGNTAVDAGGVPGRVMDTTGRGWASGGACRRDICVGVLRVYSGTCTFPGRMSMMNLPTATLACPPERSNGALAVLRRRPGVDTIGTSPCQECGGTPSAVLSPRVGESRSFASLCSDTGVIGDAHRFSLYDEDDRDCCAAISRYHRRQEMFSSLRPSLSDSLHFVNKAHKLYRASSPSSPWITSAATERTGDGKCAIMSARDWYYRTKEKQRTVSAAAQVSRRSALALIQDRRGSK